MVPAPTVATAVMVLRPWLEESIDAVSVMVECSVTRDPDLVDDADIDGTVKTSPLRSVVVKAPLCRDIVDTSPLFSVAKKKAPSCDAVARSMVVRDV